MTLTTLVLSLTLAITLVLGTYLAFNIMLLKAKINILHQDITFLDEEITRLTKQIHKNRHDIEAALEPKNQSKQLLKG